MQPCANASCQKEGKHGKHNVGSGGHGLVDQDTEQGYLRSVDQLSKARGKDRYSNRICANWFITFVTQHLTGCCSRYFIFNPSRILLQSRFQAIHGFIQIVLIEDIRNPDFLRTQTNRAVETTCRRKHYGLVVQ